MDASVAKSPQLLPATAPISPSDDPDDDLLSDSYPNEWLLTRNIVLTKCNTEGLAIGKEVPVTRTSQNGTVVSIRRGHAKSDTLIGQRRLLCDSTLALRTAVAFDFTSESTMPIILISDPSDPRLSRYADLQNEPTADQHGTFVVEGRWCVELLATCGQAVASVVVQAGRETEVAAWFDESVPVFVLSAAHIRRLVGYDFHRGILAVGVRPPRRTMDDLLGDWSGVGLEYESNRASSNVALAVLGVSGRDNLGSMIRSATALGIDRLLIGPKTADPFSRRSVRVSMGTIFSQHVYQLADPQREFASLSDVGVRTIVTTLSHDATPLGELAMDDRPTILVVGSEPDGVDRGVESIASDRVTIPMQLDTDSLNVAVAAAIFMYELVRARKEA